MSMIFHQVNLRATYANGIISLCWLTGGNYLDMNAIMIFYICLWISFQWILLTNMKEKVNLIKALQTSTETHRQHHNNAIWCSIPDTLLRMILGATVAVWIVNLARKCSPSSYNPAFSKHGGSAGGGGGGTTIAVLETVENRRAPTRYPDLSSLRGSPWRRILLRESTLCIVSSEYSLVMDSKRDTISNPCKFSREMFVHNHA